MQREIIIEGISVPVQTVQLPIHVEAEQFGEGAPSSAPYGVKYKVHRYRKPSFL